MSGEGQCKPEATPDTDLDPLRNTKPHYVDKLVIDTGVSILASE